MKGTRSQFEALSRLAKQWGIPVEDLGTLVATECSFNERLVGGLNKAHQGLIQWGVWERRHELPGLMGRIGLSPKTDIRDVSFEQQVELMRLWVEKRARERGVRIRDVHDVYRLINPGAYSARGDAFGTRGIDVLRRGGGKHREAVAWLERASGMRIGEIRAMERGGVVQTAVITSGTVSASTPKPTAPTVPKGSSIMARTSRPVVVKPFKEVVGMVLEIMNRMTEYLKEFQQGTILERGDKGEREKVANAQELG